MFPKSATQIVFAVTMFFSFVSVGYSQTVTVRWHVMTEQYVELAKRFNQTHEHIRLEIVSTGDASDKHVLRQAVERGDVDLVEVPLITWFDHLEDLKSTFQPLDPWMRFEDPELQAIQDILDQVRVEGVLYSIPLERTPWVLVVNDDSLDSGLPLTWSWDEFADWA